MELENRIIEKDDETENLKSKIKNVITSMGNILVECNNNIADAQSYAGGTYADMNDALENLQECGI